MDFLQVNKNRIDEENEARKADLGWFCGQWLELKTGYCLFDSYRRILEKLGDEAMRHRKYDDAITWYSVSSGLCPESRVIDCGSGGFGGESFMSCIQVICFRIR